MIEKEKKKEIFWTENGEPKIKHVGLLKFLEDIGYVKVKIGENHYEKL